MKKLNHIGIFLVCLFITIQSFASEPIRVACIGNSITYGAFIPNREMNCYRHNFKLIWEMGMRSKTSEPLVEQYCLKEITHIPKQIPTKHLWNISPILY